MELDSEARAHLTPEEYSESRLRLADVWAQHQERALARDRGLQNQNDSDASQGSANVRTRPLGSRFGSDGNQYNPYAPHTSEEYMLQEIEAGRMNLQMMDIPRQPSNPLPSPLPGSGPSPLFSRLRASWMAPPGHRPPYRQSLHGYGQPPDVSDPHEAIWFQRAYADSPAAEDFSEEENAIVYPELLQYFNIEEPQNSPQSRHVTAPDPALPTQESPIGIESPLTSSPDRPSSNETFAIEVPRQPQSASTGRERKRLAKPSLVVKLKTPSTQKPSQASISPRRGKRDASSSSESSSAAQITQNSRPFNLRSQGSVGLGSASARTGAGWAPQTLRRPSRRAEAIQSPQRKRRRDAVSPQDASVEGISTPTAGLPQCK